MLTVPRLICKLEWMMVRAKLTALTTTDKLPVGLVLGVAVTLSLLAGHYRNADATSDRNTAQHPRSINIDARIGASLMDSDRSYIS